MQYKILITGASGFIGTNLLQFFIENGYRVVNLDFNPPRNKSHIPYWHNIDILDYESLSDAIRNYEPDYVIHLAARTDLDGTSIGDYRANTEGVGNLIGVLRKCKNLKRVIFASSQLVCKGKVPHNDDEYYVDNYYGESKKQGEILIKEAHDVNFERIIIRLTSIWGPWFREPYRNFFDILLSGKYYHIGKRSCIKTFGYVGNTIYQINSLVFSEEKSITHKIIYIGDRDPYNIESWANEIAQESGIRIRRVPYLTFKILAVLGDMLKYINLNFPMNSYRLKNMTTNNIADVDLIYRIAPNPPFTRIEAVRKTLEWVNEIKNPFTY